MNTMSSIFIIIGIVCFLMGIFVKLALPHETQSNAENWSTGGELIVEQEKTTESSIDRNDSYEKDVFAIDYKDWEKLTKDDEVYNFTKRVNESAQKKDYYSKDFRRALYDSFHEETCKYLINKYNNGKSFSIIDADFPK